MVALASVAGLRRGGQKMESRSVFGGGSGFIWAALVVASALVAPAPATAGSCSSCDTDANFIIDEVDTLAFVTCVSGPSLPYAPGCQLFDQDGDGDVDQLDFGLFQTCLGRPVAPVNLIITEFMASNGATLADEDGDYLDWLEIYNPTSTSVSLNGWYLTDKSSNLTKWKFPDVSIESGDYLIVWATEKNRAVPGQPLHTNFRLEAGGEYLALVKSDGLTVVSEYTPTYPVQTGDVSYGVAMGSTDTLVASTSPCRAAVLSNAPLPTGWLLPTFNDSSWLTGNLAVGYERTEGFENLIGLDVDTAMASNNSVLIRIPFTVDEPTTYNKLLLYMRYDDGFVAYLNGEFLAKANAPTTPAWNSKATTDHPDYQALTPVIYDVSTKLGALLPGQNILAVHGLNNGTGSTDFLILPELYATRSGLTQPRVERYFTSPSPGDANGSGAGNMGPTLTDPQCSPALPNDPDDLTITVGASEYLNPVASVTMYYRVMYGTETSLTMLDDGAHGDGLAGDGVYGATIPASLSTPGQMVRWYFLAADDHGQTSRWPLYDSPTNSAQYLGTVVNDPAVTSQIPVLQWFAQNTAAAETNNGTRASAFFLGRFYDNIEIHLRGMTSEGWTKKNLKFKFNSGDKFFYALDQAGVDEFNLNSTFSDKAYIRQVLSWETYRDAGAVGCISFPMRVQRNGQFYSVAVFVEEPEEEFLTRQNLDPEGALYKMTSQLEVADSGVAEKKTRETENWADIQALVAGIQLTGTSRVNYLFDNVDIPACINYWAATTLIHDNDHVQKNYYMYRDTNDTGEWRFLPWDKDLTFGRNYGAGGGVLSDGIWAANDPFSHPLFGDSDHQKVDNLWNRLIDALSDTPAIRQMYLRRLRTVMDAQLQPPGTPAAELKYENRINELVSQMQTDVLLDRAAWALAGKTYGTDQDFATAIGILKNQYLAVRRTHLYNTHGPTGDGLIPAAQPPDPSITFGTIEHSPTSGKQDEEYIELVNANTYAVDISGWLLQVYDETEQEFETKHTFHPGTVVLSGKSLYATPRASVFRARTTSPRGGEGRLIQGNYDNHIAPGEIVRLVRTDGTVSASITVGE